MSIPTVSGEPSEGATDPDRQPRGPRPPKRRAPIRVETVLKEARPPRPLPEPKASDAVILGDMHHMHGGASSHFPSVAELPKPEPWEPEAQIRSARRSARNPTPPRAAHGGGGSHFPSAAEAPKLEPWEIEDKRRRRRK